MRERLEHRERQEHVAKLVTSAMQVKLDLREEMDPTVGTNFTLTF